MTRSNVLLGDLTVNNLGIIKKINEVTLPTSYAEQWYTDALKSDQIVKLGFFSELPVAVIKCKAINSAHKIASYESSQQEQINSKIVPNAIYIESFAVLQAYRNQGIGSKLLEYVKEETKKRFIHEILVHVHVTNKEAISWYEKRGFSRVEEVKNYYEAQGLPNPDALVLSLKV